MKVGVLGGGQLGRMLGLAGIPMGLEFVFLDANPQACSQEVGQLIVGDISDPIAVEHFLDAVDIVTYEFENVPLDTAELVAKHKPLFPSVDALRYSQHRLKEKTLLQELDIPTTAFLSVNDSQSLQHAANKLGYPFVLKTVMDGYDGKGQYRVTDSDQLQPLKNSLFAHSGDSETPNRQYIAEAWVNFDYEVSIIAARDQLGHCEFYPVARNTHENGILTVSIAPTPQLQDSVIEKLQTYARLLMNAMQYVGVISIEFFYTQDGLIANEFAPRVHNSGHWTMNGAITSQFENHLRAICGWPLGKTLARKPTAMLNLIGKSVNPNLFMDIEDSHLHWYGKAIKPERKVGHINLLADTYDELVDKVESVQTSIIKSEKTSLIP